MTWIVYKSNCGCLVSQSEPQLQEFATVEAYQEAWKNWKLAWERQLLKHEEVSNHHNIGNY